VTKVLPLPEAGAARINPRPRREVDNGIVRDTGVGFVSVAARRSPAPQVGSAEDLIALVAALNPGLQDRLSPRKRGALESGRLKLGLTRRTKSSGMSSR
jgi:hypothetical protein